MNTVYLGLGTNLGDRMAQLNEVIDRLEREAAIEIVECSFIYETAPIGYTEQPFFYNMVVKAITSLTPDQLLQVGNAIEQEMKRVRTIQGGPRTIDIDILLYGDQIIQQDHLTIPHPRLHERAFVVIPLMEVRGDISIPGKKITLMDAMRLVKNQEIERIDCERKVVSL